ncbi:Hpt domain-containing protein [Shewanella sp. VB17]|uniref:Hpt domain-containing protein n=1 Tax=Shewanella sp. VB17 TaxID=2739432 RepID=UPI001564052C|nr:Hpt domain-containing protein [Shewanella sp. VB17]NRD72253.1 Hpt domain-containing protein [Shewanella sp. VB17]
MDDYLSKPIDSDKVINMLKKWLPDNDEVATESTHIMDKKVENQDKTDKALVIFDYEAMAKRLMNDPVLIKAVAENFCQDLDEQMIDLKASIKNNDVDQAAVIMHKVKGASANVGGETLSALALEMELAGKAGNMGNIEDNLDQLEHHLNSLKVAMAQTL